MGRQPIDQMSQARLTNELRCAIDRAMAGDHNTKRAMLARVARLIGENPTAYARAHVQHNLGRGRRAWLAGAGFQVDATHLVGPRHGRFASDLDIRRAVRHALSVANSTRGTSLGADENF